MRRRARLSALVAAALAAAGALVFTITSASAATNTIANPGFETGSLASWTCDASASAGSGHAHSGTYQLTGAAGADTAQCAQTVPVAANTSYTLTAWVSGAYVFVGVSGGATASTWTTSRGYAQLSVTFT
ncbi:MAG TPA: carbohydrate binding domain-containing protein, partial [Rugosimonospora sp.]|nr:carbohydrate binding domain-containing protein [Rugosimonospora sp.]